MTKQKELASLIQKGLEMENVVESENCFFEDLLGKFYVCALGAGLVGKFGSAQKAYDLVEAGKEIYLELEDKQLALSPGYVDIAAELLEIDFDLADSIDKAHMLGASATAITERLEQGTFPY